VNDDLARPRGGTPLPGSRAAAAPAGGPGAARPADDRDAAGPWPASVTVCRRVEWQDTDAAGHYHHSTVIRWVESAETVLHQRLGLTELMAIMPRVRYEVDYSARLYYRDEVEVALAVTAVGATSARFAFEVTRVADDLVAARGQFVVVHIERASGGKVPWSPPVRRALLTAGPQPPERQR
jgi:YbgC/YbaW family acyl-CoA thioester hydrolase